MSHLNNIKKGFIATYPKEKALSILNDWKNTDLKADKFLKKHDINYYTFSQIIKMYGSI